MSRTLAYNLIFYKEFSTIWLLKLTIVGKSGTYDVKQVLQSFLTIFSVTIHCSKKWADWIHVIEDWGTCSWYLKRVFWCKSKVSSFSLKVTEKDQLKSSATVGTGLIALNQIYKKLFIGQEKTSCLF